MMIHEFFFFKQKTAYEMRIRDWSSDVCSSDLEPADDLDTGDELDALRAQINDAETRAAAAKEAQLRATADLENTRRRLERDAASSLKYATEKLLTEIGRAHV